MENNSQRTQDDRIGKRNEPEVVKDLSEIVKNVCENIQNNLEAACLESGRGEILTLKSSSNVTSLNEFAKIFSQRPYVAIVQNADGELSNENLYLSTPNKQENIIPLTKAFVTYAENPDDSVSKLALYQQMRNNNNALIKNKYDEYLFSNSFKATSENFGKFVAQNRSINTQSIGEPLLRYLKNSSNPFGREINENNRPHVEMVGLQAMLNKPRILERKKGDNFNFNVGLASDKGQNPATCAVCSSEISALGKIGLNVNVSAMAHQNIPPGVFVISGNIRDSRDLTLLKAFLEGIKSTINKNQSEKLKVNEVDKVKDLLDKIDDAITHIKHEIVEQLPKSEVDKLLSERKNSLMRRNELLAKYGSTNTVGEVEIELNKFKQKQSEVSKKLNTLDQYSVNLTKVQSLSKVSKNVLEAAKNKLERFEGSILTTNKSGNGKVQQEKSKKKLTSQENNKERAEQKKKQETLRILKNDVQKAEKDYAATLKKIRLPTYPGPGSSVEDGQSILKQEEVQYKTDIIKLEAKLKDFNEIRKLEESLKSYNDLLPKVHRKELSDLLKQTKSAKISEAGKDRQNESQVVNNISNLGAQRAEQITQVTSIAEVAEIVKTIREGNFEEALRQDNGLAPTENGVVSWSKGLYSDPMVLSLLKACNPESVLASTQVNTYINAQPGVIINKSRNLKNQELGESFEKFMGREDLSLNQQQEFIHSKLKKNYGYFEDLEKLVLSGEDQSNDKQVKVVHAKALGSGLLGGATKNEKEQLLILKNTPEYNLYQATKKEKDLTDEVKEFLEQDDKKSMIIPVNIGEAHWTAFIINKDDNEAKVTYIDTTGGDIGEVNSISKKIIAANQASQGTKIKENNIQKLFTKNVQHNGYDCGPLMIETTTIKAKNAEVGDKLNVFQGTAKQIQEFAQNIRGAHRKLLDGTSQQLSQGVEAAKKAETEKFKNNKVQKKTISISDQDKKFKDIISTVSGFEKEIRQLSVNNNVNTSGAQNTKLGNLRANLTPDGRGGKGQESGVSRK